MKFETTTNTPKPWFTVFSSTAVIIGIVIGIGIFRLPPLVAANAPNETYFILFWVAGGLISLTGALCYAGLSSSMPDSGGEYNFLTKAYGPPMAFLLAWGRMTVIQTGSIALIAFIFGDYASVLFNLGPYSSAIYAVIIVTILTGINIAGTAHSGSMQNILTVIIILMIIPLALAGIFFANDAAMTTEHTIKVVGFDRGATGLAMIFVLLTFGGWSEAAYLSGELYNVRKNMLRSLVSGILIISLIYILINIAYLNVLGFEGLKNSETVGYDLTEKLFGKEASILIVLIILIATLSTTNATIITGARSNYVLGRDYGLIRFLGIWNQKSNTPVNALLLQAVIALILIGIGTWSQQAIITMVDYTAPVFWFFMIMVTFSIFIFKRKNKKQDTAFKIPLYPLPVLIFLAACLYMFYSSVSYTGFGALISIAIIIAGIPVYLVLRKYTSREQPQP